MALPWTYQLNKYVKNYSDLTVCDTYVFCNVCCVKLMPHSESDCNKHVNSQRHIDNKKLKISVVQFYNDLAVMMTLCKIPWHVVEQPSFRDFWNKYGAPWRLPSLKHLRVSVLPEVTHKVLCSISSEVRNSYVWVAVDESMDNRNKKIVNVVLRRLLPGMCSSPYLIASKEVAQMTETFIADVINGALQCIKVSPERVLIFVTNGVSYMIDVYKNNLQAYYPNAVHITCIAYALHHVIVDIRKHYPLVETLIEKMKQFFSKSALHKREFRNACPNIPLPPEPVLTQWGSWIETAIYYATYFDHVQTFVRHLPSDSNTVIHSKRAFQNPNISNDLNNIKIRYCCILDAFNKLLHSYTPIKDTVNIINEIDRTLGSLNDEIGIKLHQRWRSVLEINSGLKTMRQLCNKISAGNSLTEKEQCLNYVPLTSVDVERSFAMYHQICKPPRHLLKSESKERILIMSYYFSECNEGPFSETFEL